MPSVTVKAPVKVLAPLKINRPEPDLVTAPEPLTRLALIVRSLAGVVPAVVITNSWLVPEVVMPKAPPIDAAPAALSCRMPPSAVALVAVIVRLPPSVMLPPERRIVLAKAVPVSGVAALTK